MNQYTMRALCIRLLVFAVSSIFMAFGAALFLLCATGMDPFGVLMQGLSKLTHLSNGIAHFSINGSFLLIIFLIDRHYIHSGTFVSLLCMGPTIDFASLLLRDFITEALPYPLRFLLMLVACLILGLGLSFLLSANVGVGPNDILAPLISDKLHVQFRWVRIGVDASYMVAGFLMGGTIGPGTIACVLLVGPVAQFFMPFAAKTVLRLAEDSR